MSNAKHGVISVIRGGLGVFLLCRAEFLLCRAERRCEGAITHSQSIELAG